MNQDEFLLECGKSYPEAMAALAYFRRSVQQQCKPVVQKYIKEFAEVLGVGHKDLKLAEYAEPDKPAPAVSGVFCLGWQAKRSDDLYLYFYLCWVRKPDENSQELNVMISIWLKDPGKREDLVTKLDQHSEDEAFKHEPWYTRERRFWIEMREGELPQVSAKLDALLVYTIRFLKSIEGIEECFRI